MADDKPATRERSRKIYSTEIINQLIKDKSLGYDIPMEAFFNRDIELKNADITFKMTKAEMGEYNKCYDEPLYFISNYCKFMTDNGLKTVELRDYQKRMIKMVTDEVYDEEIDDFVPKNRNSIILAARQIGKTTTIAAFMSWMITFHSDRNILIVANKEKTAIEIVDKITKIFKGLPFFLKPGCINFAKTGLKLDNGSQIISSATTSTSSIGFTIHAVLLDEFAHIADSVVNNFWRSVYPTLSSSKISQCIITSTPNGTTNKFYDIWSKAITGQNTFAHMRVDYWEVPGHDDAWAEKQKADFGEEEFAQEFELQFNINSKMLVKANDLQFMDRMKKQYVTKRIDTDNIILKDDNIQWHPDFDPNDIDPNDKFIFIVDLAEGNNTEGKVFTSKKREPDFNSINIFQLRINSPCNMKKYSEISCGIKDAFRFVQVGRYKCNSEDEMYCGRMCSALAYDVFEAQTNENVKVMVEMNFNGKSFMESMMKHPEYTEGTVLRTYHTKPIPGERQNKKIGFKTTGNKEFYCLKGAKMIGMRRIIVNDIDTMNQIQSFGYVKGKLGGIACHDDLSMPVFNHIPRMLDESSFLEWMSDYMETIPDSIFKVRDMNLMSMYDDKSSEMSDSDFSAVYGTTNDPFIPEDNILNSPYLNGAFAPRRENMEASFAMALMDKYKYRP